MIDSQQRALAYILRKITISEHSAGVATWASYLSTILDHANGADCRRSASAEGFRDTATLDATNYLLDRGTTFGHAETPGLAQLQNSPPYTEEIPRGEQHVNIKENNAN
jgi:hypothetical protein